MAPPAARGISSWLAQPFPPTVTVVWREPGSLLEQQRLRAERHVPTANRPICPRLVPCRGGVGCLVGLTWAWGDYGLTLFFLVAPGPRPGFPSQTLAFAKPRVRESV